MRVGLWLILALVFWGWVGPRLAAPAPPPSRVLVVGIPAWGPSSLEKEGRRIPAGCGPEAARLLLWYWGTRLGEDWVQSDPEQALARLHTLMGTTTVHWEGLDQGLTWPWRFAQGLEAYVRERGPEVRVRTLSASLGEVFTKAVELVQDGNLPVLLFDWEGRGGVFPNHYALVVGHCLMRRELVVNPGWGYAFQIVPFDDPGVGPVQLFWLEGLEGHAASRPLTAWPGECVAVRAYGRNVGPIPWCGADRAEELGPGLIRLIWD